MTRAICLVVLGALWGTGAALAEWTILLVMQGDNNLSFAMHQNISLFKRMALSPQVNILVQWDEPLKHTTWRYRAGGGKLLDNASQKKDMGIDPEAELIDAAKWAFKKYPAKKKALILWNHGSGVLDEKPSWKNYRGILYDFSSRKCLTNLGLLRSLQVIKKDVLGGASFDIIGMDACLMAMLEIAYQIHPFAKFFVASENITLTPGWHYEEILKPLVKTPQRCSKKSLSHRIVQSFEQLNKRRSASYTQSAMDLSQIVVLKESVNMFATHCLMSEHSAVLLSCIKKARLGCVEFDKGNFIDLYDFYRLVKREVAKKTILPPALQESTQELAQQGQDLVIAAVIAHVKGRIYSRSRGISIYFPRGKKLHRSYATTLFAAETMWPKFIERFAIPE